MNSLAQLYGSPMDFRQVQDKLGVGERLGSLFGEDWNVSDKAYDPDNPLFGVNQNPWDRKDWSNFSFNWQDTGPGNTGTLTAFNKQSPDQPAGTWNIMDRTPSQTLKNMGKTALAIGAGYLGGQFLGGLGGAGAAGAGVPGAWEGLSAASFPEAAGLGGMEAAGAAGGAEGLLGGTEGLYGSLGEAPGSFFGQAPAGISGAVPEGVGYTLPESTWGATTAAGVGEGTGSFRPSANYGEGMSGVQTSAYDTAMNLGGTPELAKGVSSAVGMLDSILGGGSAALGGGGSYGGMASGLLSLYNNYNRKKNLGQLASSLKSLYQPGGYYSQYLEKQLQRQDAASGRRSQYGPRNVELLARLADSYSRQAPTLQSIYNDRGIASNNYARGLLSLGDLLYSKFWPVGG